MNLRGEWTKQLVTGALIGTMAFWSTIGYAQQFGSTTWVTEGDLEKPSWWKDRGVLDDDKAVENSSPVNTGQLKWITRQLHEELGTLLPEQANLFSLNEIIPESPAAFEALMPYDQDYQNWKDGNRAIVTLGQVKNSAYKFYNELNKISPEWVLDQIESNGLQTANTDYWQITGNSNYTDGGYYPWNPETSSADNKKPANIGQLKSVFSLRLRESKDGDLLPDIFEHALIKYDANFSGLTIDDITWNPGDIEISIKEKDDEGNVIGDGRVEGSLVPNIGGVSQASLSVAGLLAQHEPVGSLSGALNVGGDGASNYTIPIKLPRGAGGLTPDLAINYSSNGSNGLLGMGMDITGFQTITRGRPHRIKDGYIPAEYKPLFSEQDRYYLNGEILVGIEKEGRALTRNPEDAATYVKGDGVLYKTEKEGFDRILGHGTRGTWGPQFFTAKTKNGQTMQYGKTEDACINDPYGTGIHSWYLNKVQDVSGNYYTIDYERDVINASTEAYEASDFRPKRVRFTANDAADTGFHHEVVFHYEDRPDRRFGYMGGIKMHQAKRLRSIDVNYIGAGGQRTLWSYDFKYKVSRQTGRSLLEQVCQRTPGGIETPPTFIKWNEADVEWGQKSAMWKEETSWNLPELYRVRSDKSDDLGWKFVDVNSDGYLDLIRAQAEHGKDHYVGGRKEVLYNNGSSYQSADPRDPDSTWDIPEHVWTSVDIKDDLKNALLATSNPLAKMGDFDGDGQLDFLGKRTDNSEDTDWSWSGTRFETWIRMWFPVHTRNLVNNSWDTSELDLRVYDKNRKRKGYRFAKGLTYDEVLDLDGDGDLDFVLKTAETDIQNLSFQEVSGHRTARMFINKLNEGMGWIPGAVNVGIPIDPYNSHNERDLGARLVDVNGDGLTDVIKNDGAVSAAHININCAPGWFGTASNEWAPPRPLVDPLGNDLSVRTIDFNGDGLLDVSDLSGTQRLREQVPLNQRWLRTGDRFRDGRRIRQYEYRNFATGEEVGGRRSGANTLARPSSLATPFYNFDQDGDGHPDFYISRGYALVLARNHSSSIDRWHIVSKVRSNRSVAVRGGRLYYWLFTIENEFTGEIREFSELESQSRGGKAPLVPDGLVDVGGVLLEETFPLTLSAREYEAGTIYFNRGVGVVDSAGASINSSAWADETENFEVSYVRDYSLALDGKDKGTEFIDLNGDRLTDMVASYYLMDPPRPTYDELVESNGSFAYFDGIEEVFKNEFLVNTGYGFEAAREWCMPAGARICESKDDVAKRRRKIIFKDLNGDGFEDLIHGAYDTTPKVFINQAVPEVITSVTDGFDKTLVVEYTRLNDYTKVGSENKPTYTKGNQATMPAHNVGLVDASWVVSRLGEPRRRNPQTDADYFWKRYYYSDLRYDQRWQTSLGFGWMETIDETKQQCTHVEYRRDYPFQGSPVSTWSRRIGDDGTYENGVTLSEETVTYDRKATHPADLDHDGVNDWNAYCVGTGGFVYSLYQTGSVKKTYDIDGSLLFTTNLVQEVGDYGNVLSSRSESIDATTGDSFAAETVNDYFPANRTAWQLANVRAIAVTSSVSPGTGESRFSGPTSVTKKTGFTYYADGMLKDEILEPDMATRKVTKTYTYDVYGNANSESVTAYDPLAGAFETRMTESLYEDGYGRFLTGERNEIGHYSTHKYENASSTLTWSEGANKLRTQFFYDVFATRILTKNADGTQTAEITQSAASAGITDEEIAFIRRTQSSGSPPASVYVDHIGRELYTEATDFHGRLIRTKVEYDNLNRKLRESYPYLASSTPSQWVTITDYDAIHRPMVTEYPDGTTQTVSYDKFKVTQINRAGHVKTIWKDLNQRNVKVIDNGDHTMRFLYDVAGNVRETIVDYNDGTSHSVTTDYDQVFNYKLSTTDPAFGTSYSRYNGFGEVYEVEDANGNITRTSFDRIGRVATRTIQSSAVNASGIREGFTRYTYDTAPGAALGSLHRVEMFDRAGGTLTYSSELNYDSLGRVTDTSLTTLKPLANVATATSADYETFHSSSTYDALGRVVLETNAGGLTALHTYNELGFEDKLVNYHTGEIYWEPKQFDVRGNLVEEYLADGTIRNERQYDEVDTFMERTTTRAGNAVLQDMEFEWDVVGNMQWREDHVNDHRETFTFDGLNRMQTSQVQGNALLDYTYTDNGNLTSKPGAGTLVYDDAIRKHAVTKFTKNGTTTSFNYDANGHMISEQEGTKTLRSVAWTGFGKVRAMSSRNGPKVREVNGDSRYETGSSQASFYYDAELNRIHQLMQRTEDVTQRQVEVETTYLGSYERKIHRARDDLGEAMELEKTVHKHIIGGFAIRTETVQAGSGSVETETHYQLTDHLGSVTAIVGESATSNGWEVVENLAFDAWGARRDADTWSNTNFADVKTSRVTTRGFTGHEMLDEIGLVHMNGRIYHAELGRFLSPDPFVQEPEMSQNFNRYTYVLNNPISYTDPSGYFFAALVAVFKAFAAIFTATSFKAGIIAVGAFIKSVALLVVAIGSFLFTSGTVGGAFLKGFAFGFINGMIQGTGIGGSLKAGLIGGIQAAVTAGFAEGLGDYSFGFNIETATAFVGHGVIQGVTNVAMGWKFGDGFINGVISKGVSILTSGVIDVFELPQGGGWIGSALRSTFVGAVTATMSTRIQGGSWGHSFFMAAMSHLFNQETQKWNYSVDPESLLQRTATSKAASATPVRGKSFNLLKGFRNFYNVVFGASQVTADTAMAATGPISTVSGVPAIKAGFGDGSKAAAPLALPYRSGGSLFKHIGSLKGKRISEVKKILEANGFRYGGRTDVGYIKFYGLGTKKTRAQIQIRPNGQVVRSQHTPRGSVRYNSSGNVIQDHSIGEVIGGNFSANK